MQRFLSIVSFILSIFASKYLFGDCRGKFEVAPTFAHLDILNFGKTVKTMDLPAIKADGNILLYKGLCIRPGFMYGSNRGSLLTTGCGLGFAIPYKKWCFTPSVGVAYTQLKTHIPIDFFGFKLKVREKFHSWSPYISLEIFYRITKCWRTGIMVQYAWSRSKTTIENFGSDKSNAKGPNYAFLIERDLNEHWSINLGFAYNISLTREKHGIRGYGMKMGLAYWF